MKSILTLKSKPLLFFSFFQKIRKSLESLSEKVKNNFLLHIHLQDLLKARGEKEIVLRKFIFPVVSPYV